MESALDKLIEIAIRLDEPDGAGLVVLRTGSARLELQVAGGILVDSFLDGQGKTFTDYLLDSGRVDAEAFDRSLRIAKESDITIFQALEKSGAVNDDMIRSARQELAAERFVQALESDLEAVESGPWDGGVEKPGERGPRLSTILVEALHELHESGRIEPLAVPPYALVRPTQRLGKYLAVLRSVLRDIPLPRVGGEPWEELAGRYGGAAPLRLSLLLRLGMLKTEFAREGQPAPDMGPPRMEGLASLMLLEAKALIGQLKGNPVERANVLMTQGDLLQERFGALVEARSCYEQAALLDTDLAAGRLLVLLVLGPAVDHPFLRWPVRRIASCSEKQGEGVAILAALACRRASLGAPEEAFLALHEAFGQDPVNDRSLAVFVQILKRHSRALRDVPGVEASSLVLEAVGCARELGMGDLVSNLLMEGGSTADGSADMLAQAMDLYREKGWSPDLVETVVDFACEAGRKGWTNPLWSLGGYIIRHEEAHPLRLVMDIYEVLVKASPNRREALDKLVKMVEGLNQPNLLLDLLERSLDVLPPDEPLEAIYARLALLYLEQFGDLKEASRYASHCLVQRPESPENVALVIKAARAGKLSRSSGYRFAKAMTLLSAIPTAEKLDWLMGAARIAEKDLKDLPLSLALLRRVHDVYGPGAGGKDVRGAISRLEGTISGLTGERQALRDGLDLGELVRDRERIVGESEALKRLARISLQFEDGREEACRLLGILLDAGICDWDAVELALVKLEDPSMRRDLIERVASSLDGGLEHHPPLPLLEEMAEAWRDLDLSGQREIALLDSVHKAILAVSPFHRESVRHLGKRSSSAGDVDRIVQFTERRIATARPQERGNLYVELASYGDLIQEYEGRAPTFWRIASSAMPGHPSVLANDFMDLYRQSHWSEAVAWIETNLPLFPRSHRPRLFALMRRLADRAGDGRTAMDASLRSLKHAPWDPDLAMEVAQRAASSGDAQAIGACLETLLAWHAIDPRMFMAAERLFAALAQIESGTAILARAAGTLASLPLPGSEPYVDLLEQTASLLADAGQMETAAACLERASLSVQDPEKRTDLLIRLADLLAATGEAGTERLLVSIMSARRSGAPESILGPLLEEAGADWTDPDMLRSLFSRSIGPESVEWVDVIVAVFLASIAGRLPDALSVLEDARLRGGGQHVGLAAAALRGLEGGGREEVEALAEAAAGAKVPAEASAMWTRVSRLREDAGHLEQAADAAIAAFDSMPAGGETLARAETLAAQLRDAARLSLIYDSAQSRMPGRKSEQALHYRFGKYFEDLVGDRGTAMEMYLRALSIHPKPGASLEAVERLAHRMQKHDALVRACQQLRAAGRERPSITAFIARNTELFLEEENLASAYNLILDAVKMDPGLDLFDKVKLMAERSQAGRASAEKIVHRWIPLLEKAIVAQGDDTDLPRRLDAVVELRHMLAEGPTPEAHLRQERHSVPPEADAAWGAIGRDGDEQEITFEQQVPPREASLPDPGRDISPLETALEDSKVTLMPKPRAMKLQQELGGVSPSEPPPPVRIAPEKVMPGPPAAGLAARTQPPAVDVEEIVEKESPTLRAERRPPVAPPSPRSRQGVRRRDRRFHITSPLVSPRSTEGRTQPPAEQRRGPDVLEDIGRKEEVEHEVIMRQPAESIALERALTSPPSDRVLHDMRRVPPDEDDCSVEVLVGEDPDFPASLRGDQYLEELPVHEPGPVVIGRIVHVGDEPGRRLASRPWDLDIARAILSSDSAGPGAAALLRSLLSLCDEDPRDFRPRRPAFRDSRATLKAFGDLLLDPERDLEREVMTILWDSSAPAFKERIGVYGLGPADQITPFSTGPVAPILEKAIRSLGYQRMAVFSRRERRYEVQVVRTTPPSVAVILPLGRLPTSLEFYIARCFWAVSPRRILAYSLPIEEGERAVQALAAAFGAGRQEKYDSKISSLAQDLWRLVPSKSQERLREILSEVGRLDLAGLQRATKTECTRAAVLFSGDLASAVRHELPDDLPQTHTGSIEPAVLSGAIESCEGAREIIRFAFGPDVLSFLDSVLA